MLSMVFLAAVALTACNPDFGGKQKYDNAQRPSSAKYRQLQATSSNDSVFGEGGLFGSKADASSAASTGGGIGVNDLLWRASLDTVSFMPLISADPFGGVVITDWYSPPQTPDERFKINIYILGRALRADGIRATVFRQQNQNGQWIDAPVALNTNTGLENAILTRARQLRIASNGQ
jgi:hypothetical protein